MKNTPSHIDPELVIRVLSGDADEGEQLKITQWINVSDENRNYFKELSLLWETSAGIKNMDTIDTKEDWKKVHAKIRGIKATSTAPFRRKYVMRYQLTGIAAAVVFCAGLYFVFQFLSRESAEGNSIVTTLEGSKITLPDGSAVYLNGNSKLTYPENFNGAVRSVDLVGEAFFEVVPNSEKPFQIRSGNAITEVVGTSFNINSISSDSVVVTVVTGKVSLYEKKNSSSKIFLTKGEQGILKNGIGLEKKLNDDANFLSWQTGILVFHNTDLEKVVRDLSRHYEKDILIATGNLEGCRLTATFEQQTLEEVLSEMQMVLPMNPAIADQTIVLTGKGCRSSN
jgi:ferric-dicitrate binding protein FerR (iron transport regulator)